MEVWNFSKESEKNRRELGRTDICSKLWLQKRALFRCCDAPQKIKKERKGEERRERKRRKEGKEERKRRKGKEGKEERKGRKGRGKKGERKRRGKEGEEVVTKVSRVDMGRA